MKYIPQMVGKLSTPSICQPFQLQVTDIFLCIFPQTVNERMNEERNLQVLSNYELHLQTQAQTQSSM